MKLIIVYGSVKRRTNRKVMDVKIQRGADCGSDNYF